MIVLGETQQQNGQPSLEYCKSYAQELGVPIDKIYIDFGPTYGPFETLFSNLDVYSSGGSFSLPWDAVLDGDNMEYMFCSMVGGAYPSVPVAIEDLLAD